MGDTRRTAHFLFLWRNVRAVISPTAAGATAFSAESLLEYVLVSAADNCIFETDRTALV
jgi:hypothetical protein